MEKKPRYKILIDHITELEIFDRELNKRFFKQANNILANEEYKDYSIEDVARIAFICGEMYAINKIKLHKI